MELIGALALAIVAAIAGIVAGATSKQLAEELRAWTPWIIKRLVRRAVRKLPKSQQERYEEEWRAHIDEIPGEIGKLFVALRFQLVSRRMVAGLSYKQSSSSYDPSKGRKEILPDLQNIEYEEGIIDVDLEGFVCFFNDDVMRIFGLKGNIQGLYRSILNSDLYKMIINRDKAEEVAKFCYQHPYAVTNDIIYFKDGRMIQRTSSPKFDDYGNIIGRRWRFRFISYYRDPFLARLYCKISNWVRIVKRSLRWFGHKRSPISSAGRVPAGEKSGATSPIADPPDPAGAVVRALASSSPPSNPHRSRHDTPSILLMVE